MQVQVLTVALLAGLLLGAFLAWLQGPPDPPLRGPEPDAGGPAPWEVSQLMEEARRIAQEGA